MSLFERKDHAELYKVGRPVYNRDVYNTIFKYCEENGRRFHLAVDVACGSGQSTLPLLARFKNVIGVDISEEQLKFAPKEDPNISFKRCQAESLPFIKSGSVDLVTAATSIHWFKVPAFFQETERILAPGGCLAVYGYGIMSLQEPKAQKLWEEFNRTYLDEFNSKERQMLVEGYATLRLPFPDYVRYHIDCEMNWSTGRLCDYIASTVRWQKRLQVKPDCDGLKTFAKDLAQLFQSSKGEDDPELTVTFPVSMLLGKKPEV